MSDDARANAAMVRPMYQGTENGNIMTHPLKGVGSRSADESVGRVKMSIGIKGDVGWRGELTDSNRPAPVIFSILLSESGHVGHVKSSMAREIWTTDGGTPHRFHRSAVFVDGEIMEDYSCGRVALGELRRIRSWSISTGP